jgi:hypothetical protein
VLHLHNLVLGISLGIEFGIENLQEVGRGEPACAGIVVPINSDITLIFLLVQGDLYPVLDIVGIRISVLPCVFYQVNVLE